MGIVVPFHQTVDQGDFVIHLECETLPEAICKKLEIPLNGKALALRMNHFDFFSNVEVVSIWLATQIDPQTFECDENPFDLTETLSLLLAKKLEKKLH